MTLTEQLGLHRPLRVLALTTFFCSWAVLALTAPGIPIVWDEAEYLFRAQFVREWFLSPIFSKEFIQSHWLFINYAEGHPAGFILPIALGQLIAAPFGDSLTAARLGPITLFSIACAAIAVHLRTRHGIVAAIVAPVTLLTFPRIFSEAHFATQDGQLTAWWLLLWVTQSSSTTSAAITGRSAGTDVGNEIHRMAGVGSCGAVGRNRSKNRRPPQASRDSAGRASRLLRRQSATMACPAGRPGRALRPQYESRAHVEHRNSFSRAQL